jgi:hypothetical protein
MPKTAHPLDKDAQSQTTSNLRQWSRGICLIQCEVVENMCIGWIDVYLILFVEGDLLWWLSHLHHCMTKVTVDITLSWSSYTSLVIYGEGYINILSQSVELSKETFYQIKVKRVQRQI